MQFKSVLRLSEYTSRIFPRHRLYTQSANTINQKANDSSLPSSKPVFDYWIPPPNLKYPVRAVDPSKVTPSGWVPPQGGYENLPFRFYRSSAGNNLPVYIERKRKTITAVRRFRGDKEAIAEELRKICPGSEVFHCAGSVAVVGDHRAAIQAWLLGLGF
ncbi:hypothetical protein GpartN1_g3250.t1 [Galdieria partita]|uniref:Large ribosomal subunit protein mL49 n=1 Tax=Galdieria partita TaxID=83374 RepID=A0A9C7PW32_9RHOD|nr:hypothetical protein GpartN1_g3250.t1 [Galdieria partita]